MAAQKTIEGDAADLELAKVEFFRAAASCRF